MLVLQHHSPVGIQKNGDYDSSVVTQSILLMISDNVNTRFIIIFSLLTNFFMSCAVKENSGNALVVGEPILTILTYTL